MKFRKPFNIFHFLLGGALIFLESYVPGFAENADLVLIPSGNYRPLYAELEEISVPSFRLDKFAVTREQFRAFVLQNPQWQRSAVKRIFADSTYLSDWASDRDIGTTQSPKSPVRFVSWFAARAYCEHYGKRLPQLAEWEYAAASYKQVKNLKQMILNWYSRPTEKILRAVGSTFANDFGAYDMHELIWEWVDDFNSNLVTGESRADGSLDRSAFCGSGALGASDFKDYAAFMRYGFRTSLKASFALSNLGFRCAQDVRNAR